MTGDDTLKLKRVAALKLLLAEMDATEVADALEQGGFIANVLGRVDNVHAILEKRMRYAPPRKVVRSLLWNAEKEGRNAFTRYIDEYIKKVNRSTDVQYSFDTEEETKP